MNNSPQQNSQGSPRPGSFYIPSLDGIRAASFLIVFLAHAGLERWVPGYFGLTVFFFLSGYLITTLLRIEFDRTGSINIKDFYLRRILRIFPPFYLVLGVASALSLFGLLEGSLRVDTVILQMLHLSNYLIIYLDWWTGRAAGTYVYWSLAIEEHFYLLFPLFYLWLRRHVPAQRHQALVLAGICGLVLLWRCILIFGFNANPHRVYLATDTRIDSILFGCILAVYGNPVLDRSQLSERWLKLFWVPFGIAMLGISVLIDNPQYQQTFRYTLQGLALFPLFILAIRYQGWVPCRVLNVGWIKYIGVLTYSLYLMHETVLYLFVQWTDWHPALQGMLALTVCLLLATAIHRWIEQPSARLRNHLLQRRAARASTPVSTGAPPPQNRYLEGQVSHP